MKLFNFVYEVEDDGGAVHAIEGSSPKRTKGGGVGSPASTAPASSPPSSSRFGFSSPFGKKSSSSSSSSSSTLSSSSSSVAPTPLSPVRSSKEGKASTKKGKKAQPPPQSNDDDYDYDYDYDEGKSQKKSSSSSSSKKSSKESSKSSSACCCCRCCNCSTLLTYGFFLLVVAVVGVLTWRYGPWARRDGAATAKTTTVSFESSSAPCPDCCNGKASYCDLALDDVVFPAVRRAHSSYANNFVAASNSRPFEEALSAGYRALQFNTCVCEALLSGMLLERNESWGLGDSNLGFCDTLCAAGVRDPTDVL